MDAVAAAHPELRVTRGRKVLEVRPQVRMASALVRSNAAAALPRPALPHPALSCPVGRIPAAPQPALPE